MSQYAINQIINALEKSWTAETQYPGLKWNRENPARGQCVVSALVVQDYFGGELRRYTVENGEEEKHFVNVLPDGQVVDVTRSQYGNEISLTESTPDLKSYKSIRQKLLADQDTSHRYQILGARVAKQLAISEMESR